MVTCKEIKKQIERHSGVPEIGIKTRKREIADLKKIYCKLCKQLTKVSITEIGNNLRPNYNHASVLAGVKEFDNLGKQLHYYEVYEKVLNTFLMRKSVEDGIKAQIRVLIKKLESDD